MYEIEGSYGVKRIEYKDKEVEIYYTVFMGEQITSKQRKTIDDFVANVDTLFAGNTDSVDFVYIPRDGNILVSFNGKLEDFSALKN